MDNRLAVFVRNLAGVRSVAPGAMVERPVVLPEQTLTVLRARRPVNSPVSKAFRERGFFVAKGTVMGWVEQPGQSSIPLQISVPDLERATATTGGSAITINLDEDAARYLPPRTRLELAIRIIGEDEQDVD